MITTDELKVQLADYGTAVKDLEEALAIDASRKRVQELEHTMSRPGFYDDAELSKKVFDEVGDLKGKLNRFEKLQGLYDDAETMLVMLDEEYDPDMVPEAEEAVNAVGKAVDELQLMTMLNGLGISILEHQVENHFEENYELEEEDQLVCYGLYKNFMDRISEES